MFKSDAAACPLDAFNRFITLPHTVVYVTIYSVHHSKVKVPIKYHVTVFAPFKLEPLLVERY